MKNDIASENNLMEVECELDGYRDNLVDAFLLGGTIMGIPIIISIFVRFSEVGFQNNMLFNFLAIICVIFVFVYRKRISFTIKSPTIST